MSPRIWGSILFTCILATDLACGTSEDVGNVATIPPALSSVTPAQISARGGELVTLHGSQLAADTTVLFDDAPGIGVKVLSPTELTVLAPPLFAGSVTIKTASAEGATTLANALQVTALDLRFVQAPTYSFTIANDIDAGPDASVDTLPTPPVNAAVAADFDGDGDPDLVTCADGEECHFLSNDGKGNFTDTASQGEARFAANSVSAHTLAVGDFDGDGDPDLFAAGASGVPAIATNDGHAHFTETPLIWAQAEDAGAADAGATPELDAVSAVAVTDIDGDGKPDLVIGNVVADETPFRILKNTSITGAIRFAEVEAAAVPTRDWLVRSIVLADVDGNGEADIVVSTPGAADGIGLRLLLGNKGVFTEARGGLPNAPGATVTALAAADLNADGSIDIVAAGSGQDRLLINDGSGHFFDSSSTSMPLDDTTATSIVLADLDRDRNLDLVIGNQAATTRLYLNAGGGVFHDATPLLPIAAGNAAWVAAADVDGDSILDILMLSAAPTLSRLYLSVEPTP